MLYDEWARWHVANPGIDDQASLDFLAARAEACLRGIAQSKIKRLWLSVLRSIPLPVLAHIAMLPGTTQTVELIKIATSATARYGAEEQQMPSDRNGLNVEAAWLEAFEAALPAEVGRFLGAAHTWYFARGWYRIAGKGAQLRPPQPIDMQKVRDALARTSPEGIVLMPSAEFSNIDELRPQLDDYDRRTNASGAAAMTGMLGVDGVHDARKSTNERAIAPSTTGPTQPARSGDPLSWWKLGLHTRPGAKVSIHYPLNDRTLVTTAYLLLSDDLQMQLDRLVPFVELVPSRLGMSFEAFALCCRATASVLRVQTGILELEWLDTHDEVLRARAQHQTPELEDSRAGFLFSVMHRGYLPAPTAAWKTALAAMVAEGGLPEPQRRVEDFIRTFTRAGTLDASLQPSLFLDVDAQTLALDLLAMPEFFNFCLRKLTAIDDAASLRARRGAHFEQDSWATIERQLNAELVVPLNQVLSDGAEHSEIDIAFRVDGVVVVLECKSWQKSVAYFRGDRLSVERRQERLRRTIGGQLARAVRLLKRHLGCSGETPVLSFVCVAGPEFVKRERSSLWYGATQRVLTPDELVALIGDSARWQATLAVCRQTSAA